MSMCITNLELCQYLTDKTNMVSKLVLARLATSEFHMWLSTPLSIQDMYYSTLTWLGIVYEWTRGHTRNDHSPMSISIVSLECDQMWFGQGNWWRRRSGKLLFGQIISSSILEPRRAIDFSPLLEWKAGVTHTLFLYSWLTHCLYCHEDFAKEFHW